VCVINLLGCSSLFVTTQATFGLAVALFFVVVEEDDNGQTFSSEYVFMN
jgi:hypothetical protein